MALYVQRPNGTEDVTPKDIYKWYTIEKTAKKVAQKFGFSEIRMPTFENTELFKRSVGETTDVVQKEMYTVIAKESKFTLRPEGTAGTIRSVLQNGMLNEPMPQRLFYILSCFRHERPQAGRLREFHQFGVEMLGSQSPLADAEVISLAKTILDRLGLKNIALNINSIGCPTCRAEYHKALKTYFNANIDKLCDTCHSRLEKNPMRILDCKSPICSEISSNAPVILDYLCEECSDHFDKLKKYLKGMEIEFNINPRIVRGLDYYTKTVFEFITTDIGAQGTVCGGGRYDGLIQQLGGAKTPALGFAMGIERLILTMQNQGCDFIEPERCELYIATMGENAILKTLSITQGLREEGFRVEYDVMNRSLKAQMKYADKLGAFFTMVLGDNEIESGVARLKNMKNGEQIEIKLDDKFIYNFTNIAFAAMVNESDDIVKL